MKRLIAGLTLASAALAPLATTSPAQAHAPSFAIAGFQYTWYALIEAAGHTNYVGTPAGPVSIAPVQTGYSVGNGPSVGMDDADELLVTNFDRVAHTFTHCTSACDSAAPLSESPTFDVNVPAGEDVAIKRLPLKVWTAGTYTFFCNVHPFMRGSIRIS